MADVGIVEHPTTVTEKAYTESPPGKGLSFEVKTTMPLEGTIGAMMQRLKAEEARSAPDYQNTPVDQHRQMSEDEYWRRLNIEAQRYLVQVIAARAPSPDPDGRVHGGDDFAWLNRVSAADAVKILDERVIGGEKGLGDLAERYPEARAIGTVGTMSNEQMLNNALALRQRLSLMPQAPKTAQRPVR